MAIIHPYADPSAHGKVTPGLMFKRRGPTVVFGATPRPRDKNTPAQQLQRDKITQAVIKYKVLNYEELIFLRRRGSQLSKNPYQLYTSSQLKNNDWSKIKGHQLETINNIVIFDRQQDDPNDMLFELQCILSGAYPDNIKLYNNLDSETLGVITSAYGPNFVWSGTPSHIPCKFDDGVFSSSTANYVTTDDNGQFFKELFNKSITAFWFKTTFNVTNGKPSIGGNRMLYTWLGDGPGGGANLFTVLFNSATGLQFTRRVEGSSLFNVTNDPAITFSAGDKVFLMVVRDRDGIDGGTENFQVWFGNEDTITQIITDDRAQDANVRDGAVFGLLTNEVHNRTFSGTIDNFYITDLVTSPVIQQQIDGRNIEKFMTDLGNVFDNENVFTPGETVAFCPELRLKISSFAALDWAVPFYWALNVTWSNPTNTERTTIIRFPKTVINSSTAVEFWLAQDMSDYFDRNLFRLGGTDNV